MKKTRKKKHSKLAGQSHRFTLAVIGAGYVGLVTAACFAELGKRVLLVENKKSRLERLRRGIMPFYEPGLESMVRRNIALGRISFTMDAESLGKKTNVFFIAVGTPTLQNGNVDMKAYWQVIEMLGRTSRGYTIIVNKSTVPIGTARKALKHLRKYHNSASFDLVSFPEFLREGSAISDFLYPDRLIVGSSSARSQQKLKELIAKIRTKKLFTNLETAEMIKYASNAFLATKISFINEIANVCEKVGADVTNVALGMGMDKRIGKSFLQAGIGYGGSCFPKDVKALKHIAGSKRYSFKLLKSVIEVNNTQRKIVFEKLKKHLGTLRGKTIAILGLAFKSNTDDVRESAALEIARQLIRAGALVIAHDPIAEENAKKVLPPSNHLVYCDNAQQATLDAEAVVIATEWKEFAALPWGVIKKGMAKPLIVDGRNILIPSEMRSLGFIYESIGR